MTTMHRVDAPDFHQEKWQEKLERDRMMPLYDQLNVLVFLVDSSHLLFRLINNNNSIQ